MKLLLYTLGAENKFVCQVSFNASQVLGMLPYMQKVFLPVRYAAHLSREHQFSGSCKGKQACKKSHYRHLQILFPQVRAQDFPLNPAASLAVPVLASQAQVGNLLAVPSCCAGPWHTFCSDQLLFSQAAVTGCSQGPIGYNPSAKNTRKV